MKNPESIRWHLVVQSLNIKNKELLELTCEYLEFNKNKEAESINSLVSKLGDKRFRKAVKREYINIITYEKEYYIEGDEIIELNDYKFKIDDLIFLFGYEFVNYICLDRWRDYKIKEILN